MKTAQWFVLIVLALLCAGCARKKLAALYVPAHCIQKVSWTKPCDSISEHLVKCDGVLLTTSCVSSGSNGSGAARFDARALPHP